jgi:predicted TPR repeat methyltransferase
MKYDTASDTYCIRPDYRINLGADGNPIQFQDILTTTRLYQVAVYQYAARLIRSHGIKNVLDIGCGLGVKLNRYIRPVCREITGVDCPESIDYCRRTYRFGEWIADDIEDPQRKLGKTYDLILSADVIEHLADPDQLLRFIRNHAHPTSLVLISTPDRDRLYGPGTAGPPANRHHVREWNSQELKDLLESRGFSLIDHRLLENRKRSPLRKLVLHVLGKYSRVHTCQSVLCRTDGSVREPVSNMTQG